MWTMEALGWVLVRSLRSVEGVLIQDEHCFELLGYDILLDAALKPWLLEVPVPPCLLRTSLDGGGWVLKVNASPSLVASNEEDRQLKTRVLTHTLDIVDLEHRSVMTGEGTDSKLRMETS